MALHAWSNAAVEPVALALSQYHIQLLKVCTGVQGPSQHNSQHKLRKLSAGCKK